jgi:phospholipase C
MAAVQQGIQHVIYILKENRTYDQILGDLGRGNGDPALAAVWTGDHAQSA